MDMSFEHLIDIFSQPRLAPYLKSGDSPETILKLYNANVILCESLIPALHYFEISLRNKLDKIIGKYYGSDWLINTPPSLLVSDMDRAKINETYFKFKRKKRVEATHDDIVAQMPFGFWCSFFQRRYDPILWHRKGAIKMLFPNLLRIQRSRTYFEQRVLKIKDVRNRIAHHEPVWNRDVSVVDAHNICRELLRAMSLSSIDMLNTIDRFPQVLRKVNACYC